jgi:hypothetical protein
MSPASLQISQAVYLQQHPVGQPGLIEGYLTGTRLDVTSLL